MRASERAWREGLHEASTTECGAWKIAKWARKDSWKPPNEHAQDPEEGFATTHSEKAEAFGEKFFPSPPADLSDIPANFLQEDREAFVVRREVGPNPPRLPSNVWAGLAGRIAALANTCTERVTTQRPSAVGIQR